MQKIYLDNAATTRISDEVIVAVTNVMQTTFGNPSSTHQFGRSARALVEKARKSIASHFNVTSTEIIFTAGGSEADNLILTNAVLNLGVKRIITSKIEHHAILHTLKVLEMEQELEVLYVNIDGNGAIDYTHLNKLLLGNIKSLVSLMYVNNEIGNMLDLRKVSKICQQNSAFFHSDTVQGIAHFNIDLKETAIDFMAASAHKFHGPKGVGFAIMKKGFGIKPMLFGGEQERGARAGTENVHNIVGMEVALTSALTNLVSEKKYILSLKNYLIEQLKSAFKDIEFNGNSDDENLSSYLILNARFSKEIPMMLFSLDLKGIAVSGGSACQSGSNKGSHVLNEILLDTEAIKTSVRFSFSKYNTMDELDYVIDELKTLIHYKV